VKYGVEIIGFFFSVLVAMIFWRMLIVPGSIFIGIAVGIVCMLIFTYLNAEKDIYCFPNVRVKKYLVCIIGLSILSVLFISNIDNTVYFLAWDQLPALNLLRLLLSSLLSIFFPGYMILSLIDKSGSFRGLEKAFLSILISLLVLPFLGILTFAFGSNIQENGISVIILLNSFLVIAYVLKQERLESGNKVAINLNEKMILLSLLVLIASIYIFSKYSLNFTWDYGDFNYYFGNAVSFTKSTLPVSVIGPGSEYPFWLFIFLAESFVLSGVPYVNAFQFMLIILSFLPILSFYIMVTGFFKESRNRKIPIIATVFGFFGMGFGWLYGTDILSSTQTVNGLYDLFITATRTGSGYLAFPIYPLYTVLPYYVTLATIFALIWLVYSKRALAGGNVRYGLIAVIIALGFLLYIALTVILISIFVVSIIIFRLRTLQTYRKCALSIIFGLSLVALVDIIMGGTRYTYGDPITQYGFSFFYGTLSLAALGFFLSSIKNHSPSRLSYHLRFSSIVKIGHARVFKAAMSFLLVYVYGLCFLIVSEVLVTYGRLPTQMHTVSWYAWPVRLGISGLIALPAAIYLINRDKSAKEYSFFMFLVPIAFAIGRILHAYPFYFEDRLTFFVMMPTLILASYVLLNINEKLKKRLNANGKNIALGIILSTILILGFLPPLLVEEAIDYGYWSNSKSLSNFELEAFNFLRLNTPSNCSVLTLTARSKYLLPYAGLSDMQARINRDPPIIFDPSFAETAIYSLMKSQVKYIYLTLEDEAGLEHSDSFSGFVKDNLLKYLPIVFQNEEVTIYEVPHFSIPTSSNTALVTSNLKTGYFKDAFDESYDKYTRSCSVVTAGNIITLKTDNSTNNHDFELPVNINPKEYPYVTIRWKTDGTKLYFYLLTSDDVYYTSLGRSTSWQTTVINLQNYYDFVRKKVMSAEQDKRIISVLFRNFEKNSEYSIDFIRFAGFPNGDLADSFFPLSTVALSHTEYSTVLEDDPVRFCYSTLILTRDLNMWSETGELDVERYLQWVNQGGRLIVMESLGTYRSYENRNLTLSDYLGWRDENLAIGWITSECSASFDGTVVTVKTNDSDKNHDFVSPSIDVDVESYPYVVVRWKTSGSRLYFYPHGTQSNYCYINLGASTEWVTSAINLKDFYDVVLKNNTGFEDSEQIDKLVFRSFTKNATYSIDYIQFYKEYPLPTCPAFADLLQIYTNGVSEADGIKSETGRLDFPSTIAIPVINSNDMNVKIIANYTVNNERVSPYAFAKKIGEGEVIYLVVSPYFSKLKNSTEERARDFFSDIGSLLNVLDLSLNRNIVKWTNYFSQFDFIKEPVNFTGNIVVDTDYIQLPKLNVNRIATLSSNGMAETINLNNSIIEEIEYDYPVRFRINASEVRLSKIGLGKYLNIEIIRDFNLAIEIPENNTVKISMWNDGTLLNETFQDSFIQLSFNNNPVASVLVKNPTITTEGDAFFNRARIHRNHYKMPLFYDDGANPFEVIGKTTFKIEYSDNGIIFVDAFIFNGKWFYPTTEQKQSSFTEMDIPWFNVLTSPLHILLVTLICAFSIAYTYLTLKRVKIRIKLKLR